MTGIAYSEDRFPPVPAVRAAFSGVLVTWVEALVKLDTGADRTVVPTALLDEVGAVRSAASRCCVGYDGVVRRWPLYVVSMAIIEPSWPEGARRDFPDLQVFGTGAPEGTGANLEVLIGRDVLAAWLLHLDGPHSRWSVD